MQDIIEISQNQLALSMALLILVFICLVFYFDYKRGQYDKLIPYFVSLIETKPEKTQEEIMKTLIVGLALANSSERRLYKIITESGDHGSRNID